MATHQSILAWEIPWTEEPGGLQTMGLQRVGRGLVAKHTHVPSFHNNWLEESQRARRQKGILSVPRARGPSEPQFPPLNSKVDASQLCAQAWLGHAGVTVVTQTALPSSGVVRSVTLTAQCGLGWPWGWHRQRGQTPYGEGTGDCGNPQNVPAPAWEQWGSGRASQEAASQVTLRELL